MADGFAVEVNVFDGSDRTEVFFQMDGGPWHPMQLTPSFLTDTTHACAHRWVAEGLTARGIRCLRVRATDSAWGTFTAEKEFAR